MQGEDPEGIQDSRCRDPGAERQLRNPGRSVDALGDELIPGF